MRPKTWMRTAAAVTLLGALAACGEGSAASGGDSDRITITPAEDHGSDDHDHGSHDHGGTGDRSAMTGDPEATPADELDDAQVRHGDFDLLDGAPEGAPDVSGTAYLARTDDGTTLTVDLTGLEPDTDYMSHLHEGACADGAGDHFKFDGDGSDQPPNEVHLIVPADADGGAATTITNENPDSQGARSMVLHLEDGTKFACADLS